MINFENVNILIKHDLGTLRKMQYKLSEMFDRKNNDEFVAFSFEQLQNMEQELTEAVYIKTFEKG